MKIIDLHTHSNFSDGTFPPSELVMQAKNTGLSAIALTDHDTADGIGEAIEEGKALGLEVVPGVEMVAEYLGAEIHILGYFIEYEGEYFIKRLSELAAIRADRNERLIKRLATLGMAFSDDDMIAVSDGKTLTRLHFAKAMAAKGYARSVSDAYLRYLDEGRPAFVGRNAFDFGEVINIIRESGGISSLAHPYSYKWKGGEVIQMIERLRKAGLNCVEAIYPAHDARQTAELIKAAKRLGLKITGGSDFHGGNRPDIKIGSGRGNIAVGYEILEGLRGFNE